MAQNVIINGVTYSNVPEVNIPKSGGGTAAFFDTSDATLDSGAKMLSGNTAYANGTKYTGSIATKSASDLTASGDTVTVPSGYYASSASKAVASGSATTPATTITANPTISVSASGLITASVSKTQNVTPSVTAGYVSSGTSGTITVNGSNTNQLTTKSAQTYTPTTSDQTIASGQYLIGAQTVKGDANLLAENIKKDVVLFGITGTLENGGGGGGGITTVYANSDGHTDPLFYVDGNGVAHNTSNFGEASVNLTVGLDCLSGSLLVLHRSMLEPGTPITYTNGTLLGRVDCGSRATNGYRYWDIVQVD